MSAPAGNDTQTAPTADTTRDAFSLPAAVKDVLTPLASLRLTVALFALSIALVFFGTLAQHRKDVWDVVHEYFRCGVAFVEFQDLLPPSFFPSLPQMPGGFYFPGGWLIGGVMAVNLLAAHAVRFKIQASGPRLSAGLAVLGIGSALTYLVIQSGMGETFQADPLLSWQALWNVFRVGGWLGTAATLYWLARELVAEKRDGARIRVAAFSTVPMVVLSAWLLITPTIAPESMRILWQLMKGTFAGLVLLVGCLMVFKKRAGIVLLHAGVGLLMLSELLVGLYAQEGQLRLYEGETRNYIEDIRTAELAIVDDSDPTVDRVVVVPISLLREGGTVSHPELPFDIEVARLLPNARVRSAGPVEPNTATAGIGRDYIAEPARAATGVDVGSGVDLPAAYLNIVDPDSGVSLGTYLASVVFEPDEANRVTTSAGQTRAVSLRFEREYLPVEVTLNDVRKVDYVGTSTPRDYSSFIRLLDGETGVDRDVRVWMNNPLRYSGRTFYQSSYIEAAPAAGRSEGTVLQVVTNEGWMLPYVSCMVVAVGMVAQFVVTLLRFLGRETRPKPAALLASTDSAALTTTPAAATACCDWKGWAVPAVITLAFAGYLAGKFRPPAAVDTSSPSAEAEFDYAAFGRLPVAFGGRVKPLDTLARNAMKQINGNRETYKVVDPATGDKTTHDAIEWLAAVVAEPAEAAKLRVFRIENLEVLQLLGLEKRKGFRYSLSEFVDRIVPAPPTEFQQRLSSAFGTRRSTPSRLTDFERDLLAFVDKLGVPPGLLASGQADERERVRARLIAADPGPIEIASPDLAAFLGLDGVTGTYELDAFIDRVLPPALTPFQQAAGDAARVRKDAPERLTVFQRKLIEFTQKLSVTEKIVAGFGEDTNRIARYFRRGGTGIAGYEADYADAKANRAPPLPVPYGGDWETFGYAQARDIFAQIQTEADGGSFRPADTVRGWDAAFAALREDDAASFNAAVAGLDAAVRDAAPEETDFTKVAFESAFNHASPFFYSWILYIAAFVLTALGWLTFPVGGAKVFLRSATLLIVLTFLVHTAALAARIYISGRPPVTNLYSSAVFIGWGTVGFGLLMERFFGLGFGNAVATLGGGATLLIARSLSADGDTFTVMQAVLDTQFWLATHVVCITLGYTATYVGGLVGLFYICAGAFTPALSPTLAKKLTNMNYGAQCFAIFFSFVGTVLGGLWADDSWGRFWGWDPKENGALMIVTWNALVLHANWGRLITPRGLAALAVAGNIVVSWSWFGVNELGVGLHSYGFTEGVLQALGLFAASQLIAISLTFLPTSTWWSGRKYGKA